MKVINLSHAFQILGLQVDMFSSETYYGWKTAAIINDFLGDKSIYNNFVYYMDNEYITLETAIDAYQSVVGRMLSAAEVKKVMNDNFED